MYLGKRYFCGMSNSCVSPDVNEDNNMDTSQVIGSIRAYTHSFATLPRRLRMRENRVMNVYLKKPRVFRFNFNPQLAPKI